MNTKLFLFLSLLVSISLLTSSCSAANGSGVGGAIPGSGHVQSETRDLSGFSAITVDYPGAEITVQQGDPETVQIEAEDNVIPQISTTVSVNRLTIASSVSDWKERVNPTEPVKITVMVKNPTEIEFASVGNLDVNELQEEELRLVLSGGAQVKLNGIQVNLLDTVLSGAGDIQADGTADELKLVLSGLGNFNAAELKTDKATIELSGMGNATVQVESELSATVSGAGSVNYIGNPHIEQTISGAGSVQPAKDEG